MQNTFLYILAFFPECPGVFTHSPGIFPILNILARKMVCYDVFISVYTFTFVKKVEKVTAQYISGAPAARRAVKRSPILIWERKGNPSMSVLMVIMASGIARGRVRTTTTTTTATESCKMAAILQILG